MIFIELPRFTKTETELETLQDKWLYFIKNAGSLEYIPEKSSQEIKKAFDIVNEANLSEEELELQHKKKDWIYIQKSSIQFATKQGIQQGQIQNQQKMVLNCHKAGMAIAIICNVTELEESVVRSIIANAENN